MSIQNRFGLLALVLASTGFMVTMAACSSDDGGTLGGDDPGAALDGTDASAGASSNNAANNNNNSNSNSNSNSANPSTPNNNSNSNSNTVDSGAHDSGTTGSTSDAGKGTGASIAADGGVGAKCAANTDCSTSICLDLLSGNGKECTKFCTTDKDCPAPSTCSLLFCK